MKTMIGVSVVVLLVTACTNRATERPHDTPTSGSIGIAVDESLFPVIDAEVKAFEAIYLEAQITVYSVPEAEAIRLLMNDSVRLAVLTRSLSDEEKQHIRDQRITPHDETVARESIAIILHPAANDSTFTHGELASLLSGLGNHRIVFDDANSGVVRYVKDSLLSGREFPPSAYALKSSEAVIEYVSRQKDAVGLIGGAWIGDRDDSTTNKFLGSIRVAAIEHKGEFYQPYQAYVARRLYPLTRNIVMSSREARSGLGSGFMSFVAGDKGQRVFLKAGLLPVTMPVRIVEVSHEPL